MDKKHLIVNELETMSKKEAIEKNFFKVRAYQKVINQIKKKDFVTSMSDLKDVEGIGAKIKDKIEEILKTGKLKSAERARGITENGKSKIKVYEDLLKIHGVGISKAEELVKVYNIKTIDELQKAVASGKDILNENQKIGLKYYFDIQEKIPRKEMEKHLRKISKLVKKVYPDLDIKMAGSYRRGALESGDMDLIIKVKNRNNTNLSILLSKIIDILKKKDRTGPYIVDELSKGKRKFMGICQLNKKSKARRIDILMTTAKEYPFALLYFTGDFDINIALRKEANELGYVLNEYQLKPMNKKVPEVEFKTEKEIFNFLGYKYLLSKKRNLQNLLKIK